MPPHAPLLGSGEEREAEGRSQGFSPASADHHAQKTDLGMWRADLGIPSSTLASEGPAWVGNQAVVAGAARPVRTWGLVLGLQTRPHPLQFS